MFFDQLDKRNAMVKSIIAFYEVEKVSLAVLESQLSGLWLGQLHEKPF
jgi:hypothetical protein